MSSNAALLSWRSLAIRIGLPFLAMVLAIASCLGLASLAQQELEAQTAREIAADILAIEHVSAKAGMAGALDLLEQRAADAEHSIFYALWDDEGGALISTNLPQSSIVAADISVRDGPHILQTNNDIQLHGYIKGLADGFTVFVGRKPPSILANGLLWVAFAITIILAIIASLAIAEKRAAAILQQRLRFAETQLKAFASGQRDRRIYEGNADINDRQNNDALDLLSQAVDDVLHFVAQRLDSQDVVAEQIVHELRSPVSHAARRLSVLPETDDAQARIVAQSAITDLLHLIDAILFITDLRARPLARTQFRLDKCVHALCDLYEAAAEEKDISIILKLSQTMVSAEQPLVERLITNLLDNAIKYTNAGGKITVTTYLHDGDAILQVDDEGPGLSALPKQPGRLMVRGSNANGQPGSGLGLALIMRILDVHGGHLNLSARADVTGLRARAIFPSYSSSSENAPQ